MRTSKVNMMSFAALILACSGAVSFAQANTNIDPPGYPPIVTQGDTTTGPTVPDPDTITPDVNTPDVNSPDMNPPDTSSPDLTSPDAIRTDPPLPDMMESDIPASDETTGVDTTGTTMGGLGSGNPQVTVDTSKRLSDMSAETLAAYFGLADDQTTQVQQILDQRKKDFESLIPSPAQQGDPYTVIEFNNKRNMASKQADEQIMGLLSSDQRDKVAGLVNPDAGANLADTVPGDMDSSMTASGSMADTQSPSNYARMHRHFKKHSAKRHARKMMRRSGTIDSNSKMNGNTFENKVP
jgi:hypothetical protein